MAGDTIRLLRARRDIAEVIHYTVELRGSISTRVCGEP